MSNILNECVKLISGDSRPKKRTPVERFGRGDWVWCVLFWHRKCHRGKEGRNCLWEEAMETAVTGGWLTGVRNITLTEVARYVWVRCVTGQNIDRKTNWGRGGHGFSSYWEEVFGWLPGHKYFKWSSGSTKVCESLTINFSRVKISLFVFCFGFF